MKITIDVPETMTFVSGSESFDVGSDKIPAASWTRLAMYGKRMCNDTVNGIVHAEKDKPQAERRDRADLVNDWIGALCDGTLGTGRGGASRLSDLEKELRTLVHSFLVSNCGYKSGEATKLVSKGAATTFASIVAKELGADDDQAAAAWAKLLEHAEAIVSQRKSGPNLEDLIS